VGAAVLAAAALSLAAGCRNRAPAHLTISAPYEVDSLDPHVKNTVSNVVVTGHIYEPLVTTDKDMRLQPGLARLWENPDPSTWVFHLRPDVKFHSGRPLRADDVVYTIRRLLADPLLEIGGYTLYIADVRALDDLTVQIRTTRPLSILLNKLRFVGIVPEGSTSATLASSTDGTGPYRLVRWVKGQSVELARNDAYWGKAPAIPRVTIILDRSPAQAAGDFMEGRAQLAQCNSKSAAAPLLGHERAVLQRRPSLYVKYLSYDMARAQSPYVAAAANPFRDLRVRQALELAVDRERLASALSIDAVPAQQIVPAFIFGFNPTLVPTRPDPAAARALLADAGFPGGFRVRLDVRKSYLEAAVQVRTQLAPLGIVVDIESQPDEAFMERVKRHDTSLFISRFGCPTGDASDILDNALHTADALRHMGMQNYGGYSNPEVDRRIEESAGIEAVADRRLALEKIVAMLDADRAWIPLYSDQDVYAVDRSLAWEPRNDSFIYAAEVSAAP
jgi:peptide/nickel transport system substrate-binding protein